MRDETGRLRSGLGLMNFRMGQACDRRFAYENRVILQEPRVGITEFIGMLRYHFCLYAIVLALWPLAIRMKVCLQSTPENTAHLFTLIILP